MDDKNGISVADAYDSMNEFWAALKAQRQTGESGSIWDTYEAGERRAAELQLAKLFGSDDAVLVNSGMAALTVAAMAAAAEYSVKIRPPESSSYFEISNWYKTIISPLGLNTTSSKEPAVELREAVTNTPSLTPYGVLGQQGNSALCTILDNSLFSVSVGWAQWAQLFKSDLLIFESIPKYLCRQISGGVIYGCGSSIERVRNIALASGVLLQRRACALLLKEELFKIPQKILNQSINAEFIANRLREQRKDLLVKLPHEIARVAGLSSAACSLVFVIYPEDKSMINEFDAWCKQVKINLRRPLVRAGYGWSETHARCYGNDELNTSTPTAYMRISAGVSSDEVERVLNLFLENI